jgi:glycosyltransferase involved in cell wall biosynthesis
VRGTDDRSLAIPVKVLIVNHTGVMGGAEHSLLALVAGLPGDVEPVLASPIGPLHGRARALGVRTFAIPGTSGSFRLHPIATPRALVEIARSGGAVRLIARRIKADLVHANSVRAGLFAAVSARTGGPPVVTHVRDILPPGRAAVAVRRTVSGGAQRTICISARVKDAFAPGDRDAVVVHNGVALDVFDPAAHDRTATRAALGLAPTDAVLGVIAQLTPWKGQDDAIAMLALICQTDPTARLLIVGETKFASADTRYDNDAFARRLREQVARLQLVHRVCFLGERADIPALMGALDVLLVPSWEEPFGRTVIEGMAMECAVVASSVGGPAEIIEHGCTGLLEEPRRPAAWAEVVRGLLGDPARRAAMGRSARRALTGRFDQATYVAGVMAVYREAVLR